MVVIGFTDCTSMSDATSCVSSWPLSATDGIWKVQGWLVRVSWLPFCATSTSSSMREVVSVSRMQASVQSAGTLAFTTSVTCAP